MNAERSFSWLKALAHSIAIASAFFLPALAFSIAGVVDATKAGEFSGGFVFAGLILGWVWSYARQRSHSTLQYSVLVILVAMSAYQVLSWDLPRRRETRGLPCPRSNSVRRLLIRARADRCCVNRISV